MVEFELQICLTGCVSLPCFNVLLSGEGSLKENRASDQVGAPSDQKVVKVVYHISVCKKN